MSEIKQFIDQQRNNIYPKTTISALTTPNSGGNFLTTKEINGEVKIVDSEVAVDSVFRTVTVGTTQTGDAGTNAEVTNSGTGANVTLDFVIPRGNDGHNPNLGSYDISDYATKAPTTGVLDGDYIVVIDKTQSPVTGVVYTWDGTHWQSTGRDSNSAAFGSGETVMDVYLDKSELANPKTNSIPKAEDVQQLKAKLDGISANEVKVEQVPITDYYVQGSDGMLKTSSSGTAYVEVQIGDAKGVRFLGSWYTSASYTAGYAYGHYEDVDGISTWVTDESSVFDTDATQLGTKEYNIPKPKDKNPTHFRTTTAATSIPALAQNFYCYLLYGDTVQTMFDELDVTLFGTDNEVVGDSITISSNSPFWFYQRTTNVDDPAVTKDTLYHSFGIINMISKNKGARLRVTRNINTYYPFYGFLKRTLYDLGLNNGDVATFGQLIDGDYLSSVHNVNGNWVSGFYISDEITEITIPEDAYSIYFVASFADIPTSYRYPRDIRLVTMQHENGYIDDKIDEVKALIKEDAPVILNAYPSIKFAIGEPNSTIGEPFSVVENVKKIYSSPIPMIAGFNISFTEHYKMVRAMTYDSNDVLLTNKEYYTKSDFASETFSSGVDKWGNDQVTPQCSIRLILMKENDEDFTESDLNRIVNSYFLLNDSRIAFDRKTTNYSNFKRRLFQVSNLVWKPLSDIAAYSNSTIWYKAGETIRGVPYSEASEFTHYYPQHVSTRTLVSSLANPWSVMYTENIKLNGWSKYGYVYGGLYGYCGPFYGTVCTGLTSYVANYPNILTSAQWGSGEVTMLAKGNHAHPNGWKITNGDSSEQWSEENQLVGNEIVDMVNEMDFIWNTGHCSVISDIGRDRYNGGVKCIVWAEQTTPRTRLRPYTPSKFVSRLNTIANTLVDSVNPDVYKEWAIYRMKDARLDKINAPEETGRYVQMDWDEYAPEEMKVDEDIMNFKGEYCAVGTNVSSDGELWDSTLNDYRNFLNVRRGNRYTYVDVYSEGDESLENRIIRIDLASETAANSSFIEPLYGTNEEGWTLVNMANKNLQGGLYKACAISSDGFVRSGFSHFEIVDIKFSATRTGNSLTCTWSSSEGTAYLLRQEKIDGMSAKAKILSSSEITEGTAVFGLSTTNLNIYRYIKLFIKGTWGTVVKRIDIYSL